MAGKGKQLFDINNLEQAKKIMQEILDKLKITDINYMTDKADEDLTKLYAELNSLCNKHLKYTDRILSGTRSRRDLEEEITGLLKSANSQYDNYVKSQAKLNVDIENQVQQQKTAQQIAQNKVNIISKEADLQDKVNKLKEKEHQTNKKTAEQEYEKLSKLDKLRSGGQKKYVEKRTDRLNTSFDTAFDTMYSAKRQEAIDNGTTFNLSTIDQIASSAKADSSSKLIEEFSEASEKFNLGSGVFDLAVDSFKKCISNILKIFSSGIQEQNSIYEQTYHNISTLTGIDQNTYMRKQMSTDNQLGDMGLYDNVKVSEVQQMWDKLATSGVGQEEMFANAIDDVITNKIVPYLNTSTTQWQQLIDMQPNLQKNIRGITEANQEIVGNNYITSDLVQQILDDLQPISDNAMNDIAMETAGATTFINSIMSSMGVDETTAKSIWTEKVKQQKYGGQIMSSGTTAEKYALINTLESGYNVYDAEDTPEILGEIMTSQKELNDIGPGYTNTMNGIIQSRVNSATGVNENMSGYLQGDDVYEKIQQAVEDGNLAMENLEEYAEDATNRLAEGETQTAEEKQTIALQNIMTNVAAIYERMGIFKTLVDDIVSGIGTLFQAYIGVKLVGGLLGSGSSSGLLAKALGEGSAGIASSIALPVVGAVAGVAAGIAIGNKILSDAFEEEQEEVSEYQNQYESKGYSSSASSALAKTQSVTNASKGSFLGIYKSNLSSDEKDELGIDRHWYLDTWDEIGQTKGEAYDKKEWYKYNNMAWLRTGFAFDAGEANEGNQDQALAAAIMYAIALDQMGMLGTTKDTNPLMNWGVDITSDTIGETIRAGIEEGLLTGWSSLHSTFWAVQNDDSGPRDLEGNLISGDISSDILENYGFDLSNEEDQYFMSHRQGLDEVPYDDYPALLHEGEAVLTASTANEMRNLVDEYRDTNEQTVNFDSVIESQTTSLLAKMDDIISAINNVSSSATAGTSESTGTSSVLRTAMKTLTSTRQYG